MSIAKQMQATGAKLHVLVSNAGIWNANKKAAAKPQLTSDGLEAHFATNYLSMVLLLTELKELLESSKARIVITGSFTAATNMKGVADLDNLQGQKKTTVFAPNDIVYAQSKLLQYMWAKKFSQTVAPGVVVCVYDPGLCETNNEFYHFLRRTTNWAYPVVKWVMRTRDPLAGASIAFWACDSPDAAGINGKALDWGTFGSPKFRAPVPMEQFPTYKMTMPSVADDTQVEQLLKVTEEIRQDIVSKGQGKW